MIEKIQTLGVPCYLRLGARGSMAITKQNYAFVKSLEEVLVVDTTGCGNSSTAAAMIGFSKEESLETIAMMGNIAAWYTLKQFGPYKDTLHARNEAKMIES